MKRGLEIVAKEDKSAEIYIYDMIGDDFFGISASRFTKELNALSKTKKLNLYINSPGGGVFDGVAIYNALVRHPAEVIVSVDGLAASIASLIAMSGNKIKMSDASMLMIHDPWGMVGGTSTEMRKYADTLDKVRDNLVTVYDRRTKLGSDKISNFMAEETWFSAAEALANGFIDEIMPGNQPINAAFAMFDFDRLKFRNTPSFSKLVEQPKLISLRAKRDRLFSLVNVSN